MQLAVHKLMTCLGLSKSDWFSHSCKDQHNVWAGQTSWLTSNQYLLSICAAGVFRRGIVLLCGCIHPKSSSPEKSGQCVVLWGLPPWKLLSSPTPRSPTQHAVCSQSFTQSPETTRLPSCISSSFYLQAVVPNANSLPQSYWSMAYFKTLSCVYPSCPPPPVFLFWINFFQPNLE